MPKIPDIDAGMVCRYEAKQYSLFDPCVICGVPFSECDHTVDDTARVIHAIRNMSKTEREHIKKDL